MGTQQSAGIMRWGLRFAPNTPKYAARGYAPPPPHDAVELCWNEKNEAATGSTSVNDVAGLKCQLCPRPVNGSIDMDNTPANSKGYGLCTVVDV